MRINPTIFYYLIAAVLLILLLHFYLYRQKNTLMCLPQTEEFKRAIQLQQQGIVYIRDANVINDAATNANMLQHFNKIWESIFNKLDPLALNADPSGEKKFFLNFKTDTNDSDCYMITMGVGNLVDAEVALKVFYPKCEFLAVDPDAAINEDLVKNKLKGTFIQAAIVSEDNGAENAGLTIWKTDEKDKQLTASKDNQEMQNRVGFFDFMLYFNAKSYVDMLSIDVEGSEFAIIQLLAEQYDRMPVTVCQINIEVHHHPLLASFFMRRRYYRDMDNLLRHGHFALMRTENYDVYYRMFFVNFVDEKCVKKFLC